MPSSEISAFLERVRTIPNERSIEIAWLLAQPIKGPVLDVGCHDSVYLEHLPAPVDGIDVRPCENQALRRSFTADIRTWLAPEPYPSITAVSTVEHVGLAFEPYGTSADDPDGDRHAITGCMANLTWDGTLYVTVPAPADGQDRADHSWYRSYTARGLEDLLNGYSYQADVTFDPTWPVGGVWLCRVWHPLTP